MEEERENEGGEQSSVPPMSFFTTPHTHLTHTPLNTMTSTNVYHVVYTCHTHTHKNLRSSTQDHPLYGRDGPPQPPYWL